MKASAPNLTPLSYTLLGLLKSGPMSGYAIRQVIERTRPGSYSASPGSIYPALSILLKQGLISKKRAKGLRHQFHLTPTGDAILWHWLAAPVSEAELADGQSGAMLRLSVIQSADPTLVSAFLSSFAQNAQAYAKTLQAQMDELSPDEAAQKLRFQHERLMTETGALWAVHARKTWDSSNGAA